MDALRRISADADDAFQTLMENINAEVSDDALNRIDTLDKEIERLQARALQASKESRSGGAVNLGAELDEIERQINAVRAEQNELIVKTERVRLMDYRLGRIKEIVAPEKVTGEFDPLVFRELVDEIIVRGDKLEFKFACGIEITI